MAASQEGNSITLSLEGTQLPSRSSSRPPTDQESASVRLDGVRGQHLVRLESFAIRNTEIGNDACSHETKVTGLIKSCRSAIKLADAA